ncbi:hypothetical protein [Streptomyces sp. NPDC002088]|uniref:hypothetical protein n=1 Tax=Streptomyces sp. NPDC002088 TaxID=3154665 RepID=UPI0033165420
MFAGIREAEARGAVSYVVMTGKYATATSADIELAMLFAEHQIHDQDEVGEYDWVPDEHAGDQLLHLRYKNTRTGLWESTINSISTVPVLLVAEESHDL